ncbi:MAG: GNAT family N-acetyltransferase [Mycobacteriales bacterium]
MSEQHRPGGDAAPVVRSADRRDLPQTVTVLTDALLHDPAWQHVVPDRCQRETALRCVLAVAVADAGEQVRVAVDPQSGQVRAVAVWQRPGLYPMSTGRALRCLPKLLPLLRLGRVARDVRRFGTGLDAAFPREPVHYLQALGVTPDWQHLGLGTVMLQDGLAIVDAPGGPCYLETGNPANLRWYEKQGFASDPPGGAALWPAGPTMWRMQRPGLPTSHDPSVIQPLRDRMTFGLRDDAGMPVALHNQRRGGSVRSGGA